MLATTAVAQVNTNKLPEIPPPALTTPAAPAPVVAPAETKTNVVKKAVTKAKKKIVRKAKAAAKVVAKKTPELPVTLVPGPATVSAEHVNLRGQAGLKGEVVGHAQKGDTVNVLSEITLDKPKAGEPAQWAKIALPSGTKVWVDSKFIDLSNNVVAVKKLNLRGGPGENFSVLGVIEKGASVTPVISKDDWMQIETPASAFAFVAAGYLKQEGSMTDTNVSVPTTVATTEPVPPPTTTVAPPPTIPPTTTTVAEQPPIAPPATTPPPTPETAAPVTPVVTPTPAPVTPAMNLPTPTLAPEDTSLEDTNLPPPPPRIVTHEGSVRSSVSPVAPTDYELYDPADGKAINYLYTTSTNLNLARYNGLHITVTGEEGLVARWKDTPVLTIQKIYVLAGTPKPATAADTNLKPVKKHWWQ